MVEKIVPIARHAGGLIMEYFQTGFKPQLKADQSPVTVADMAAHEYISKQLNQLTPTLPIISEESPLPPFEKRSQWKTYWLVDPLDGTKEFIAGKKEFTVNIARIENNHPTLGVVFAPAIDLLYYAESGNGAWKIQAGRPAKRIYSDPPPPDGPFRVTHSRKPSAQLQQYLESLPVSESLPMSSSLKLCLLAEGRADIYARFKGMKEWDVGAGDAIFRSSARKGLRKSPFVYNKPSIEVEPFVIGKD